MRSRFITIEFPVFSYYIVHVEVTSDIKKTAAKYEQTRNIPDLENGDAWSIHPANENFSFIFLKPNPSVGTIAHECWHVVKRMMDYMGVELDSETVAYHLGYLVDKVFRFVHR